MKNTTMASLAHVCFAQLLQQFENVAEDLRWVVFRNFGDIRKKLLVAVYKDPDNNGLWFITFPYKPRVGFFPSPPQKTSHIPIPCLGENMRVIWPFGKGPGKVTGVSQMWVSYDWFVASFSMGLDPKNWGVKIWIWIQVVFVALKLKNQFNSLRSEFQKNRCCFFQGVSKKKKHVQLQIHWIGWTFGPCFLVVFLMFILRS